MRHIRTHFWISATASIIVGLLLSSCTSLRRSPETFSIALTKPTTSKELGAQYVIVLFNMGKVALDRAAGFFASEYQAQVVVTNTVPNSLNYNVVIRRQEGDKLCSELCVGISTLRRSAYQQTYFYVRPQSFTLGRPRVRALNSWVGKLLFLKSVDVDYTLCFNTPDNHFQNGLSSVEYKMALYNMKKDSVVDLRGGNFEELSSPVAAISASDYLVVTVRVRERMKIYKWIRGDK